MSPLGVPAVFQMLTLLHVCLCQPVLQKDNLLPSVYLDWPIGNNCQSTLREPVIKVRNNQCPQNYMTTTFLQAKRTENNKINVDEIEALS